MRYVCQYLLGAPHWQALPQSLGPEVAFWGRSNVGKSSLLNALMGHRLARISKTPGCTQMIHFYRVNPYLYLADLPGYGYAKVPKTIQQRWENFVPTYLVQRANLWHIYLLIDSRHPITKADQGALTFLKRLGRPCTALFTKSDTLSSYVLTQNKSLFETHYPWIPLISVSAKKKQGLEPVWEHFDLLRGTSSQIPTIPLSPTP